MPTKKDEGSRKKEVPLSNTEKHVILKGDLAMRRIKLARQAGKRPIPKKDDS